MAVSVACCATNPSAFEHLSGPVDQTGVVAAGGLVFRVAAGSHQHGTAIGNLELQRIRQFLKIRVFSQSTPPVSNGGVSCCGRMNTTLILISSIALTFGASAAVRTPDKTIGNLNTAWQGESNASARYKLFVKKAESEGEKQAARLFLAASKAEEIHAAKHAKAILSLGGTLPELVLEPVAVGSTTENLNAAIKGETYERQTMYPNFIATARKEGASKAVRSFEYALETEAAHAELYSAALKLIGTGKDASYRVCPNCGFTVMGNNTADCEVCDKDGSTFLNF